MGRGMGRVTTLLAGMLAVLLLAAGVALAATIACRGGVCTGTNKEDRLVGSAKHDTMDGRYSDDTMFGRGAADTMFGDYGNDAMYGEEGNDSLYGGSAPDRIVGGSGRDYLSGDNGNDLIVADDGEPDSIGCGFGSRDTAIVDARDLNQQSFEDFVRLSGCETVRVR